MPATGKHHFFKVCLKESKQEKERKIPNSRKKSFTLSCKPGEVYVAFFVYCRSNSSSYALNIIILYWRLIFTEAKSAHCWKRVSTFFHYRILNYFIPMCWSVHKSCKQSLRVCTDVHYSNRYAHKKNCHIRAHIQLVITASFAEVITATLICLQRCSHEHFVSSKVRGCELKYFG